MTDKEYYQTQEYQEADFDRDQEERSRVQPVRRRRTTKAKKSKGRKIALTILLLGALAAGTYFTTQAVYSHKETMRVDALISGYQTDDYVVFPTQMVSTRTYDITYSSGEKLVDRLIENGINCVSINGQFYTPTGEPVAVLRYRVQYVSQIDATKITNEGQTMYVAPAGWTLCGSKAYKITQKEETKVVPVCDDYSFIGFASASNWEMIGEPTIVQTLPYSKIEDSTLICDVPDGATLDEHNLCYGTLDLAPKKR